MTKLTGTSLLMAACVLSLAACSDTTATDKRSVATTTNATSVVDTTQPGDAVGATTATTIGDITDVVHPPASGDFEGALVDVTAQTCEQQADGWRVAGTVTNPTASPVDYRIYISLLNGASTTRALVETEVLAVAPGVAATFDKVIALPDTDLRCVLRVERRTPGN